MLRQSLNAENIQMVNFKCIDVPDISSFFYGFSIPLLEIIDKQLKS